VPTVNSCTKPRRTSGQWPAIAHVSVMLLRPEYLSQKLDRPLPIKGGTTLHTIGQAVDYMTGIGKKRELLNHWQRVAKLILAKEDVLTVSRALELALFMDAKLVSKVPAK
jgi:hypothetical protein